jgi:hypothetical protein
MLFHHDVSKQNWPKDAVNHSGLSITDNGGGKSANQAPGEGGSKIESEDGRVLMLVSPH